MGLNVGDPIPVVDIPLRVGDEFTTINTGEISKGKRIVIFALLLHLHQLVRLNNCLNFEENYGKFQEKGIDEVYCLSVNDSFVMNAWFKDLGIENVKSLPDGIRSFTMSIGALCEKNNLGFGFRSWRYAIVVNDGVVENVFSEEGFGNNIETDPYEVSTPENVLDNI